MTTLLSTTPTDTPWSAMPGWGIVADLTPPELIATRGLRVLRRRIVAALVLILLLCAGGYVWAAAKDNAADDRLTASRATTTRLTAQKNKYSGIVALQTATQGVFSQISSLMTGDVDIADFVAKLHDAAPSGTTLLTTNVTLSTTNSADATTPTSEPTVGSATMSGTSRRMVDVAAYVTALQSVPGVVNVVPSTNSASRNGSRATWTITFQLTTKIYSHRFDVSAPAGGTAGTSTTGGGH